MMKSAMTTGRTIWVDQLDPQEVAALDPGLDKRWPRRPDVLVVGGGIVGVATATACRDAGLGSVLLIEADQLGAGATGGAAGLLIPEAHHGSNPGPHVALGRSSLARWRNLEENTPDGVGLTDLDWFALAPHPEGFMADPSPAVEWLDADDVARIMPGLAATTSGVLIRHQARINPLRALTRLAARLPHVATGVAATGVGVQGGRVVTVSTSVGTIAPGAVVFATGSPPAIDRLDVRLPANMVKGHLVVTEPTPLRLPGTVVPVATQLEDGRLLTGGTLDVGDQSEAVRPEVIDAIAIELAAFLPALGGVRLTHRWCCFRPHHPDGLPVIDRVPGLDNAWVTSGHYRTGILMGPATGAILAQWISTNQQPADAAPFTIQRLVSS
jgi:glycine/D-amino acid oxidase-like deaminating enzyme